MIGRPVSSRPASPMQQTLFALAALLVFSFYAMGRHQTDAEVEHDAIGSEIETAVADVARATLLGATRLAFDEEDVGRSGFRTQPPGSTPGPDGGEPGGTPSGTAPFDDVDDYHGWTRELAAPVGTDSVRVRVTAEVVYVYPSAPSGAAASSPQLAKRVTVSAVELPTAPLRGRAPMRAELSRVVTPASR